MKLNLILSLLAFVTLVHHFSSVYTAYVYTQDQQQDASTKEVQVLCGGRGVQTSNTREWDGWPAIAYEEVGHPLVTKGDSFFNHARELYFRKDGKSKKTLMDEFIQVYKNRPDPVNMCGIRINHALALFLAVKEIQPTLVVESGVNAGVSTYFIRAASPTTKIFAIDPLAEPICNQGKRWIDPSDKTTNLTGDKFVDLLDIDWKGMIQRGEIDVEKTLVFLDDHLHAFERIAGVMKIGLRHVLVEDNYKLREGATPKDKKSTPKQMFSGPKWRTQGNWLFANIVAYSEFPPIVPPIMAKENTERRKKAGGFMVAADKNDDIVHPILRPDLNENDKRIYNNIATELGIDPALRDKESYMQFMNYNQICHLELLPVPPGVF
uniref:Uncharacterized protein n=1 Tax=Ditylum brightwellii TaxID=49249 RepID=A0A7S4RP51_9STRA